MKFLPVLILLVALSGCVTNDSPAIFTTQLPNAPANIKSVCPPFSKIPDGSDENAAKTIIIHNNELYPECQAKVDSWITFYTVQQQKEVEYVNQLNKVR
jgi:hypothetical protein